MTKEEAENFIKYATDRLKGSLNNLERALLVADRKDAKEYLKTFEEPGATP